jgi:DNA-binding CsgD family transcriptional regulator
MDIRSKLEFIKHDLDVLELHIIAEFEAIRRQVRDVCAEVERREAAMTRGIKATFAQLNHRQLEVVLRMIDGQDDREIMKSMKMTKSALFGIRKRLTQKFKLDNISQLIVALRSFFEQD